MNISRYLSMRGPEMAFTAINADIRFRAGIMPIATRALGAVVPRRDTCIIHGQYHYQRREILPLKERFDDVHYFDI